ncbi:MAG TPA: hypothetical protein VFC42_13235 [Methylomirabilota bacterium]|nr:hypothetical protein [Methylomirabilota bacterium]
MGTPGLIERLEERGVPLFVQALRRLPFFLSERLLIGLAGVRALLAPARLRRVYRWAAAGGAGSRSPWAVAVGVHAHWARAWAVCPSLALLSPERLRRRLDVEGLAHLEQARAAGGVVLLGFHLGMPSLNLVLPLLGYELTALGQQDPIAWPDPPEAWKPFHERSRMLLWRPGLPATRAAALLGLHKAVARGEIVAIMGDAGEGRALFDVRLPGRPLAVRAGWFALRRLTGAPILPILGHRDGARWRLTIHPPLPPPDPDEPRDREACRAALTALLQRFVARYPEQCSYLAMHADGPGSAPPGSLAISCS